MRTMMMKRMKRMRMRMKMKPMRPVWERKQKDWRMKMKRMKTKRRLGSRWVWNSLWAVL